MGQISFRLPVHPRDPDLGGDGDVEGAFIRAGCSRAGASGWSEALVEAHNGLRLKTSHLKKMGIDMRLLADGLRAAGLVVELNEDNPEDYRPLGKFNKGPPAG